jgi:small subunit ribosomal protein S20
LAGAKIALAETVVIRERSSKGTMANHKSAEKRMRQTQKRTARNRARVSRIKTFVKKVESAIASGDRITAAEALKTAQPEIHRGVTKGVLHKNAAARKLSRLSARIKSLS